MRVVDGQSGTPKNQVPPISSLNGELGSDAPTQMERTAMKPKIAGRRRNDQSSGSPASTSTRSVNVARREKRNRIASARMETRRTRAPNRSRTGGDGGVAVSSNTGLSVSLVVSGRSYPGRTGGPTHGEACSRNRSETAL